MLSFAKRRRLYEDLPSPLKRLVGMLPFSVLAGKAYRDAVKRGQQVDDWTRDEIRHYQSIRLGSILEFACDQVPAYARYGRFLRLAPHEALKAFPLLSKEDLMSNLPEYLPRDFRRIPHYECTTGGTSGNQLRFYLDDSSPSIEMAFMHRLWKRVGYTPRSRKATFRGFEFPNADRGVYWQHNPVYHELQFSPFHMNDQNLGKYVEQLQRYRPQFLHGYPSALQMLASYLLRNSILLPGVKAVLLASEALYDSQRRDIQKAFRARAFSFYGHSERVILAGECEHTTVYHHFPDYGFLEIISDDGVPVDAGEAGELVGTGFLNRALPLIRYRTEDRARLVEPSCTCGRQFDRFDQVEGRWKQEFVIGRNGSRISPAALNMHGPFFDNVVRYQYYQNTPGILEVRVMVTDGFGVEDERLIHEAYKRKVADELHVKVVTVEEVPLTARGKLKRLIQEIPVDLAH